jgi:two-component system response regulator YesN
MNLKAGAGLEAKKKVEKHKILYFYILTNIIIVLLVLFITYITIYNSYFKMTETNINNKKQIIISNIDKRLTEVFSSMYEIAGKICYDSSFTWGSQMSAYNERNVLSNLGRYISYDVLLHEILLYNKEWNYIYASAGKYEKDSEGEIDQFFLEVNTSQVPLHKKEKELPAGLLIPFQRDENTNNFMTIIYPKSIFTGNGSKGTVILMLKNMYIQNMFKELFADVEGIIIVRQNGGDNLITYSNINTQIDRFLEVIKTERITGPSEDILYNSSGYSMISSIINNNKNSIDVKGISNTNNEYITIDESQYYMINMHNSKFQLNYSFFLPTSQFTEQLEHVKNAFRKSAVFILLFGIIVGFLIAINNYKPWRKLIDLINSYAQTDGNIKMFGNTPQDFNSIESALSRIHEIINDKNIMIDRINSQRRYALERLAWMLLEKSNKKVDEIMTTLDKLNCSMYGKFYRVIIIKCSDGESLEWISDNVEQLTNNVTTNKTNTLQDERPKDSIRTLFCIDDDMIICIINYEEDFTFEHILQKFKTLTCDGKYGESPSIAIGKAYSEPEFIYNSYEEAITTTWYTMLNKEVGIIKYDNIMINKTDFTYPHDIEKQLIKVINQKDINLIEEQFDRLIDFVVNTRLDTKMAKVMINWMCASIMKALFEMSIDDTKLLSYMSDIIKDESIDKIKEGLIKVCKDIFSDIGLDEENHDSMLADEILKYIDECYADANITLQCISDNFNLSISKISRTFKKKYNTTIMQYIDSLRMEKAKQLLRDTEMLIKDIIEECGYNDFSNFMRKFKNIEGITPSEYRQLVKNVNIK